MKNWRSVGKALFAVVTIATIGLGVSTADARRPPGPECGPTIFWIFTLPTGQQVPFGGTVCEKAAYELKTGAYCIPGG